MWGRSWGRRCSSGSGRRPGPGPRATAGRGLQGQASFVRRTPDADRGQALGVASSAMIATQGLTTVLAGVLADSAEPSIAIAVAGAVGLVTSTAVAVAWRYSRDAAVSVTVP